MSAAPAQRGWYQRWLYPAALFCTFALGLALRLPALRLRPMHADEAVHAVKFAELWKTGDYRYDPAEFHGPTLYYATLPVPALRRHHTFAETLESDYRLIPALFGAAIILLLPLFVDALGGRRAIIIAGLLFAVSPSFVFYSDYYIQEIPFVVLTVALAACVWRYRQRPNWGWALASGTCAGLVIATKETIVLTLVAAIGAWLIGHLRSRIFGHLSRNGIRDGLTACLTALLVACYLLTDRFAHPVAAIDYLRAFAPWFQRGTASALHAHSWNYYLGVLFWAHSSGHSPIFSEAWIGVLALVGAAAVFGRWGRECLGTDAVKFLRFVATYSVLLGIIYSAIPYKTPWCVLSFLAGLILLAGVGASALWHYARGRGGKAAVALLILAGIAQLGWQAYRDTYTLYADSRNPYVYAGTAPEVVDLVVKLNEIASVGDEGVRVPMQVCVKDGYYWPLPWYLRRFPNVGYWTGALPASSELVPSPIVIASTDWDDALTERLSATHLMTGYYGLRVGVPVEVWVRLDRWQAYLKQRKLITNDDP